MSSKMVLKDRDDGCFFDVWFVRGHCDCVFATKIEAEAYARLKFHDESEDKRYARIAFRTVALFD
jgi:hypothetical protein